MARIAVGGFHHETNTFAPRKTTLDDFLHSASYPHMPRGADLPPAVRGQNLPVAGFIEQALAHGHEILPTVWAGASPAAAVSDDAFEEVLATLLRDLEAALPVDAVYLCLHGAMVSESQADGEAELLSQVRALVGEIPIVVSLDFHANVSAEMVELATALTAFRTYPHIDVADTGRRALALLDGILDAGVPPAKAYRPVPFLIPLVWQCTLSDPMRRIMGTLEGLEADTGASLSFAAGFPLADVPVCGPSVLAYAAEEKTAAEVADLLYEMIVAAEADFAGHLFEADEAVSHARERYRGKPIVLADTQDNPGAGAASDTTWLLEELVREDAKDAALAILCDPAAAEAAHAAGQGAELELALGATSGQPGHRPFHGCFTVEALSDGEFEGSGRMSAGSPFHLGPSALLRIGGVRVVVASRKTQASDQAIFRHLGLDPAAQRILVLKSSVHFRDDFQDLVDEILIVRAPGPNLADHCQLPYARLRRGIRLMPLGPPFSPETEDQPKAGAGKRE
jgi:microcystin degradation protein MlrC